MRRRDPGLLRILKFELDECVLCGSTQQLHLHHLLFRSHGGDDVRANILALCQQQHDLYHASNANTRKLLADHVLNHRPDSVEYLKEKLGSGGFESWVQRHQAERSIRQVP